jgi:hypothetical protein
MSLLLLFNANSTPYQDVLLNTAKELLKQGHPAMAVVAANTACEYRVERVVSKAISRSGLRQPVEEAISDLLPSYGLANDRVRALYSALTGDAVHQQPFWSDFKAGAKLRNDVVHRGARASVQQAESAVAAAESLLRHLATV